MGDGWETKRNRNPENRDWLILQLAHRGIIEKVVIDTCHFKGNYPDSFTLDGLDVSEDEAVSDQSNWQAIIPKTKLKADCIHEVENEIARDQSFTHVRLSIFPDGGVSRMRLYLFIPYTTPTLHKKDAAAIGAKMETVVARCC